MTKISSFDVLKRMSVDNLDIRLATGENLRNMNAVHKGKDTDITIGVAGNVIGGVMTNELHLCLLIWNKEQYQTTKAALEAESELKTASISFTRQELEVLQSMLEVLVDGTGTYSMLRLPKLVKVHTELLDTFSAAIGRKRER